MFENYEQFINDFDSVISKLFEDQQKYIFCKKGCSKCCEKGDYPYSQIEFAYLTQGFLNLPENTKILVQQNIRNLKLERKENKKNKRFEHVCPFLINKKCVLYKYRGIVCRTFGICYYDDKAGYVRLPECVNEGLNFSKNYDKKTKTLNIADVPKINLRIDRILNSELAKRYDIKQGEIRPLLDWFEQK